MKVLHPKLWVITPKNEGCGVPMAFTSPGMILPSYGVRSLLAFLNAPDPGSISSCDAQLEILDSNTSRWIFFQFFLHPGRLTWNITIEVGKIIVLSKWVI